jgi:hypothetical protein
MGKMIKNAVHNTDSSVTDFGRFLQNGLGS